MINQVKSFLIRDKISGKQFEIPRTGFELGIKDQNNKWEQVGYVQPVNIQNVWHLNEEDKSIAIVSGKPFRDNQYAESYFRLINRIDSSFIEGYLGRPDLEYEFFSEMLSNYSYFEDYLNRKKVYFTFDKISLYEVTEIFFENPLRFVLKRLDNLPVFRPNSAFMIMPFGDKILDEFYENSIRLFLKQKFDIDVYRADNFTDNDVIIETIYRSIELSEFIIAETTTNNKNVFYELGYAVAKGREVITIQNKSEKSLFFDRAHVRSIIYSIEELDKFKNDLIGTIETIRSRK